MVFKRVKEMGLKGGCEVKDRAITEARVWEWKE